ncbi:MAG: YgcG family protein [Crocinitomicaceae bacterium]
MRLVLLFFLILFQLSTLYAESYNASDLKAPDFKTNHYIINPDGMVDLKKESKFSMLKETYFFKRLIEPIIITVKSIEGTTERFLKEYAAKNRLEPLTNGRYIIQLFVSDQSKLDFYLGSQLSDIYKSDFLNDLRAEYEPVMKNGHEGTYQYVVFQKLGNYLVDKVSFYYDLEVTKNLVYPSYPNKVIIASKKFETVQYYSKQNQKVNQGSSLNSQIDDGIAYGSELNSEQEENKAPKITIDYSQIEYEYKSGLIRDVSDVPNQRSINDIWVSNPHQIITESEANQIDKKLKEIEINTGYEIAVVFLNSINNQDAYDFGLRLFNAWGIGKKDKNNGLLIKVVLNPRALTFITGSGTELVLSDAATYSVGQDYMKPSFRNGEYGQGILKGLDRIEVIFEGNDVPVVNNSNYESYTDYSNYPWYERYPALLYYLIFSAALLAIYIIVLVIAIIFVKDLHKRYHIIKFFNLLVFPILFPLPFAVLFFFNKFLMNRWRNTVRFGELQGEIMHKLEEEEEDEYLSEGQITEERIKSIDYDVWVTITHSEILILGYKDWINKYKRCPKCTHKTYFKEYDKTIRAATYSSSGKGQTKYYCENCKHEKIKNYTIPKLRKSKSNYSRGGSSWGGGSSWSGGGGSSWGGGFSSGGGSSSGW